MRDSPGPVLSQGRAGPWACSERGSEGRSAEGSDLGCRSSPVTLPSSPTVFSVSTVVLTPLYGPRRVRRVPLARPRPTLTDHQVALLAMQRLTPSERAIVHARIGLGDEAGCTLEELAAVLGVTKDHADELAKAVIWKLEEDPELIARTAPNSERPLALIVRELRNY